MPLHPFIHGSVDLPSVPEARPRPGRPDGVRVVRRPRPSPGERS